MATYLAAYFSALITFLVVDALWLATMAARLYRPILGDILAASVDITPAILFYLIFPIGLVILAILPALKSANFSTALIYGALFGFFTYTTAFHVLAQSPLAGRRYDDAPRGCCKACCLPMGAPLI